ncbi:MAG: putative oxidoreductase C-terminal domain-containing protein [Victivallaceae bacterium]|nr:putative oxidoreductase C-terminal domain-containing protein [Victivallaceae bacterium]MDD5662644.1 putative oxidoreductase C-terminal domain-containing protein [Victivallaceae bacterium]
MHTIVIINPGHFHAGLVLREMHPRLSEHVYIYSEPGQDLDNYLKLIKSFNQREQNPTRWQFHVYTGSDYLDKAVTEKRGDIAVLAGRNDRKIYDIQALHDAGFHVLSDKPLTIDERGVDTLSEVITGGKLLMDIMTERHEVTSRIQNELLKKADIFGGFAEASEAPVIFKESVHFLYKQVNGVPLVRPGWYFDVKKQGEGIVDVTTHLVDLVQWMTAGSEVLDFDRDVKVIEAKRWCTEVPLDRYQQITKLDAFPDYLLPDVQNDILHLYSNGEFTYVLRGLKVKLKVIWNLEAGAGGGDTHRSFMTGKNSTLVIDQGPHTGNKPELFVEPRNNPETFRPLLEKAIADLKMPGLEVIPENDRFHIEVPASLRTTHEEHFAKVRNEFIAMLDSGQEPATLRPSLLSKYKTLSTARAMSRLNP